LVGLAVILLQLQEGNFIVLPKSAWRDVAACSAAAWKYKKRSGKICSNQV